MAVAPKTVVLGRMALVVAMAMLSMTPCTQTAHVAGFVQARGAGSLLGARNRMRATSPVMPVLATLGVPFTQHPALIHCRGASRSFARPISAVLALDPTAEAELDQDDDDELDPRAVFIPADENPAENSIFANMGLLPELCTGLSEMKITTPTSIQAMSLPLSLAGESVLLCAETGSGKTLAFLLPLIQRIKQDELTVGITTRPRRPRAMVLVPTRELGQQILHVAKELSKTTKFSSMGVFGGSSTAEQAKRLSSPIDLVVGTPGRMSELVAQGHMSLGDVRFLVADEADTMASQGFGEDLQKLFKGVVGGSTACKESFLRAQDLLTKLEQDASAEADAGAEGSAAAAALEAQLRAMRGPFHAKDRGLVQCVLAAATVADSVKQIMASTFPRYREVKTAKLHHVPERVSQEFIAVSTTDRAERLLEALDRGLRMSKARWSQARELDGTHRDATIVFCNTRDSALYVAKMLREQGHEVAEAHGWVPQSERAGQVAAFAAGERKILVATDIMARGIDTIYVAHVINFDFPLNPVDYLHRIGRTGRSGGTGRVTSLVGKRDATLAVAIEAASRQRRPIENLTSRRSDYVQGRPGMLKSEAPPPRRPDRPAERPAAAAAAPPARRAKPKPKDTTMKPYRVSQPKKKRAS